eukprot:272209_1
MSKYDILSNITSNSRPRILIRKHLSEYLKYIYQPINHHIIMNVNNDDDCIPFSDDDDDDGFDSYIEDKFDMLMILNFIKNIHIKLHNHSNIAAEYFNTDKTR